MFEHFGVGMREIEITAEKSDGSGTSLKPMDYTITGQRVNPDGPRPPSLLPPSGRHVRVLALT